MLNQLKENKVTKEFLDSQIINVSYTIIGKRLTHCVITLTNGFEVTGESACVDEKNFNKELGEQYAFQNAYEKLWLLYGFLLKEELYRKSNER